MKYNIIHDIRYGKSENNSFNLYIPEFIDKGLSQGIVVCIHGGGWNSLNKEGMDYACSHFASAGYLAATIGYTFIKVTDTNGELTATVSPNADVFVMLDDIGIAVEKIKNYAQSIGITLDGLALLGASSGAHLAMLFAYSRQESSAIPIKFVCNSVGPSDLNLLQEFPLPIKQAHMLISALCGRNIDETNILSPEIQQLIASASPVTYIRKNSPPTLSAYGGVDEVVNPKHQDAIAMAFKKAGVAYESYLFPNSGHDLSGDPICLEKFEARQLAYAQKYFK